MTTDEKQPKRERDNTDASKGGRADEPVGTEAGVKGGSEAAKRQAERDWKDSSKESGE